MGRRGAIAAAALAFLFFAQAQRALLLSVAAVATAGFPVAAGTDAAKLEPGGLIPAALLIVGALLTPLLPLARWTGRRGAAALALAAVGLFRLGSSIPADAIRLPVSALVIAAFGLFLASAAALLERRAFAAGAAAGLVVDHLLRLAGGGPDPSLGAAWVPIQVAASAALVGLAVVWLRRPEGGAAGAEGDGSRGGGLERRAGGLRLRGAVALGALVFLALEALATPPGGAPGGLAAAAPAAGGAVALAVLLGSGGATGGRGARLALAAILGGGTVAALMGPLGPAPAAAHAAAHAAALLLLSAALEPAGGRRGGRAVAAGLLVWAGLAVTHRIAGVTIGPAEPGARMAAVGAALVLVAGAAALLPRTRSAPPPLLPPLASAGVAAAVVLAALLLARA